MDRPKPPTAKRLKMENPRENLQHVSRGSTKPVINWTCDGGLTLLQLAVVHQNLNMLEDLLKSGCCDVNDKGSRSFTALAMALTYNNFEAAKVLLDAGAEVKIIGRTDFELLLCQPFPTAIEELLPRLARNLQQINGLDVDALVEVLIAENCPFHYVLAVNDARITRRFLQRDPSGYHVPGLKLAMNRREHENIELILRYGNEDARKFFYDRLMDLWCSPKWKDFILRLCGWDAVPEVALPHLHSMFRLASLIELRVLLNSKIHIRVKEAFGIDLRASIFGNERVDAIEIMRTQDFDINVPGIYHETALHEAAQRGIVKNVRFLLESGADVGIEDKQGRTALFECIMWDDRLESGKLLLEYGADPLAVDNGGQTAYEYVERECDDRLILGLFTAQIAISHVRGLSIEKTVPVSPTDEKNKKLFKACCQQLQSMKECKIITGSSASLYDVLTGSIESLSRVLGDKETISVLDLYNSQCMLHPLYYSTMKSKLVWALNLHRFKCGMARVISETTGKTVEFDHLVVREISKYLPKRDIDAFVTYTLLNEFVIYNISKMYNRDFYLLFD